MTIFGWIATTFPFYFATIEQYYTGELILQIIDGVDDGSILLIVGCFISAAWGTSFWNNKYSFYGSTPIAGNEIVLYSLILTQIISVYEK